MHSVVHLTQEQASWVRSSVRPHTLVSPSADSRRTVVSYCAGSTGQLHRRSSLPRKSVGRLTDHPDMTLAVYHGCETTIQQ